MFTFHKPRVYRSSEGCCICRAKSSSSRFTDSKKYEYDFMKCFDLKQPRFGEICNACVLLVKRYKRLPVGSNRHWGHVVDARAGPGTKSLTKHKRLKDEAADLANASGGGHNSSYNGKTLMSEKFSKIFKKNKKSKSTTQSLNAAPSCNTKRKSSSPGSYSWNSNHSQNGQHLPNSPDSLDSDYEDDHITNSNGSMVEFQTQTRASTYRSRNRNNIEKSNISCSDGDNCIKRSGSKRRKCFLPRKCSSVRPIIDNNVQFFDENEWQQQQSCCGSFYECGKLGGAIIVDLELYKPCLQHQEKITANEVSHNQISNLNANQSQFQLSLKKEQQQVQSQRAMVDSLPTISKPTQVLKKHHLFFKRQSELFPQSDISQIEFETCSNKLKTATAATITAIPSSPAAVLKTDLPVAVTRVTIDSSENDIPKTGISIATNTTNTDTSVTIPITSRYSVSKIAPHSSTTATILPCNNINTNKVANNILHKIKATDVGKISKNSLEKINTATVRILPADLNDMRQILKTVDRSYLLNKPHQPHPTTSAISLNAVNLQQQNHISIVAPNHAILNAAKLSPTLAAHPLISSSCSLAPKFSDNSSDSGFDENLQDRKSASPLQEDTDIKILTRPNLPNGKKIFSTGGVNTYCPIQSMPLQPGIDEANKLRQQYRQHALPTIMHQRNVRKNRTSGVKIAQIISSSCNSGINYSSTNYNTSSLNSNASNNNNNNNNNTTTTTNNTNINKINMRAHIYNNNTIKHENGVTTIVPASSLTASSSQVATLSALSAPNTVTITPSPIASANPNFKKCAAVSAGIVCGGGGLNVAGVSATTPLNTNSSINNTSNLNQKIIFVKTAKYNNNNSSISVTATTAAASAASGSIQVPHNANKCHGTTIMSTITTAAITTSLPLSAITAAQPPTLNSVLSYGSAQQNLCVKIDCNS